MFCSELTHAAATYWLKEQGSDVVFEFVLSLLTPVTGAQAAVFSVVLP